MGKGVEWQKNETLSTACSLCTTEELLVRLLLPELSVGLTYRGCRFESYKHAHIDSSSATSV